MNEKYLQNYIDIVMKIGLNLEKGQKLIINAPIETRDYVYEFVKGAYRNGAGKVVVEWNDPTLTKLKYSNESIDNFKYVESFSILKSEIEVDDNWASLRLDGLSSKALEGLDSKKLTAWQQTTHKYLLKKNHATMNDEVTWCIAAIPTIDWAKEVFPNSENAVDELWNLIFKACRANVNDPIGEWDKHLNQLEEYANKLNQLNLKTLHFQNSLGTDLNVNLVKDYEFLAAKSINKQNNNTFVANIPTEEVYSMPDCNNVNGIVYNSKPLSYQGNIIDEFYLKFKDGKVIDFDANVGKETLEQILSVDDGSKSIGEVALVSYNTPISLLNTLFYSTLFDENASCHLALGKAYPTTMKNADQYTKEELLKLGCNDSAIHVDFMFGTKDLNIVGIDHNNNRIQIFSNGNFCF